MTGSSRKIFNMILAVLVSIGAWVFVVYNYDPMTPVRYADVPVSFTGEEELAERGLAVNATKPESVAVTLNQKRVDGSSISASDISVTADVSACIAGSNKVDLRVSGPEGTTVSTVSTSSIDADVSRIRSEAMDIEVIYGEGAEEDEIPIAFDLSQTTAEVSCCAERMDDIDKIAAVLDHDSVTERVKSFTVDLAALDKDGNRIPHVVILPGEISLDAGSGIVKTVDLNVPVKDDSDDGYEREYTAPTTVTIMGARSVINQISSIDANEIDISYVYSDEEIDIEYELPEGVYLSADSADQVVRVRVSEKETEDEEG